MLFRSRRRMKVRLTTAVYALLLGVSSASAEMTASVVSVLDGDTIEVRHVQQPERIRLRGIDCPEKGQPFGKNAKQVTAHLVFGKTVTLEPHGKDKYGRTIAEVLLPDGTNVNQELVKAGWCWWYRKYALGDNVLKQLEQEARAAQKGLWADPSPIPPWEWRKRSKGGGWGGAELDW